MATTTTHATVRDAYCARVALDYARQHAATAANAYRAQDGARGGYWLRQAFWAAYVSQEWAS